MHIIKYYTEVTFLLVSRIHSDVRLNHLIDSTVFIIFIFVLNVFFFSFI